MTKLKELLQKAKFSYVNSDIIEENFPYSEPRKIELISYEESMESTEVVKDLESKGLEPANLYDLIQFHIDNPKNDNHIIALGSVWRVFFGYRYVPCLWGGSGGRRLLLRWIGGAWNPPCRFAAVRKSGAETLETKGALTLDPLEQRVAELGDKMDKLTKIINI